jgi:flagellar biosynthesis/type III secretory pathway ATPase
VLDAAIRTRPQLESFLKQDAGLKISREETLHSLERLAGALG